VEELSEAIPNHWHLMRLMGVSGAVLPEVSHISTLAEQCLEQTESSKMLFNNKHKKPELQLSETRAARNTPGRRQLTPQHRWASPAQQSLHTVPQKPTTVVLPQPTSYLPFPTQLSFALVLCSHGTPPIERRHGQVWNEQSSAEGYGKAEKKKHWRTYPKSFKLYPAFICL